MLSSSQLRVFTPSGAQLTSLELQQSAKARFAGAGPVDIAALSITGSSTRLGPLDPPALGGSAGALVVRVAALNVAAQGYFES